MSMIYRHPVALVSLFTILVLAGLLSVPQLPVELLPSLSYPRLIVRTTFGNAAPEEIETLITKPVEAALGTVVGLRSLTSVSTEGLSTVTLRFEWGSKMSLAATEVREKLDPITEALPRDVKPPLVMHYDPSEDPIVTLAFYGTGDTASLRLRVETSIKPDLETLPGVAAVRLSGGGVSEIMVLVDRGRIAALGLDLKTVANQIEAANINFPGGKIIRGPLELPVRTVGRFTNLEQIRQLPLKRGESEGVVRLADLGQVKEAQGERSSISRFNGQSAILLSIIKEPSANIVDVSRRVRERASAIKKALPPDTNFVVADDQGPFIEEALGELRNSALWGGLLALVVLLIGLRSFRSAVLIMVAIPVSVVATMGFMVLAGVSLNFMSIGGLAIGIGMLVDASIVVLESIHRHSLQTQDIFEAVDEGVREVNASVVSGAFTSVVVLIPILFMSGLAQRLFRDFAFTMGCSHIISLVTALLLLPALVLLIQGKKPTGGIPRPSSIQALYEAILPWALKRKLIVISLCLGALLASVWGLARLGFEMLPNLDNNQFSVRLVLPSDTSIEGLERAVDTMEALVREVPGVEAYITEAGAESRTDLSVAGQPVGKSNEASIVVKMASGSSGVALRDSAVSLLRAKSNQVPGATLDFMLNQSFLSRALGESGTSQLLRLVGDDVLVLADIGQRLLARLHGDPHLHDVVLQGNVWTKQIQVRVDRYQAAARGLSVREAAETVQAAVEGKLVGKFIQEGKETDIRVILRPDDRKTVEDLGKVPLRLSIRPPRGGDHDPNAQYSEPREHVYILSQIADVVVGEGPREILRTDRRRNLILNANVVGEAFSKGEERARKVAGSLDLPQGYEVLPGAERFELMASLQSLAVAIVVALMLTYAVMAVQFESVRWPLIILLTIPMTIAGPALVLNLAGIHISVLVLIGGVVLIGVVVNNGILMVAYINELRGRGLSTYNAIIQGSRVRLHPVLMSTATNVLGVLPICFGLGSGAALRKGLAITVASGLAASLIFTLFLVPVLYDLAAGSHPEKPVPSERAS
jgi:HAE1 family hydrophobic/amphiphilic exporter-1